MQNTQDLPPVPKDLVEKTNALYSYLMHSGAPLNMQLQAVYHYLDEFQPYIAQFVSCSKGCSHCCRIDIQITTLEAEYIQVYTGIPIQLKATLSSITTGHRDACPFLLKDNACGIYSVRPLMCRIYHAFGEPENCKHGRRQVHYGQSPNFGNDIFANLVRWTHHVVINGGGALLDIRDFFRR